MADLTARFQLIDEMSSKMAAIAESGQTMLSNFDSMGDQIERTFDGMSGYADSAVQSADGVAVSLTDIESASGSALDSTSKLSDGLDRYRQSAEDAASQTDDWTDAVGNYDKGMMEAIYTTEELVEQGYKTTDALDKQNEMMELCERSQGNLSNAMEATSGIYDELNAAMEESQSISKQISESDEVSAETKENVARATDEAAEALRELEAAQENATSAMDYYNSVVDSGTTDLEELEAAAEKAQWAAEDLEEANERASNATEELAKANEAAAEEFKNVSEKSEEAGENGVEAIESMNTLLVSSGIVNLIKNVGEAFMEASESAAEFETAITKISTVADTTEVSLSTLEEQITSLSKETGESVTDLSDAVYSALSASVDTADAVEFTGTATKLAAGGFTSSATAVDVLTTALNAYGLEASEAEQISDYLITTQNLGKTTVDELAASVGKVIPLASAYGVEMDNLSAAYAELTKGGIATAEAGTYLKSMLNELGDSSSTVTATLKEMTGLSFSELMEQGYSLGDVMEILGEAVDGDAGAFNELWSSSEAGIGALSLYNAGAEQFNETLEAMETSIGATDDAYEAMTDTTEHAQQEMSTAAENLKNSIGNVLNPTIEDLYDSGTSIMNLASDFIEDHPNVVKAATAVSAGLATIVAGITGVVTVTKVVKPLIASLGTTFTASLGPILAVAAGVTAVTAALTILRDDYDETYSTIKETTTVALEQTEQLDSLTTRYEAACSLFGETSEEASELKYQIDDLSDSLSNSDQSVDGFVSTMESVVTELEEVMDTYNESIASIDDEYLGNLALIQKLEDLASSTNKSADTQEAMKTIIDQLNSSVSGLNLTYSDLISNTDTTISMTRELAQAQADLAKYEATWDSYVELLEEMEEKENTLAVAEEEWNATKEAYGEALETYNEWQDSLRSWDNYGLISQSYTSILELFSDEKAAYEALREKYDEEYTAYLAANTAYNEAAEQLAEYEEILGITSETTEDLTEKTYSVEEAVSYAYGSIQDDIESLCAEYDEAYNAALESFQGQFSIFDEATTEMQEYVDSVKESFEGVFELFDKFDEESEDYTESTVANAQAALNSQLGYWETYAQNIQTLSELSADDLGITQENYELLMSYISDGSESAAGLAESMANAAKNGNESALTELANTAGEIAAKQEEIAESTAEWAEETTGTTVATTQAALDSQLTYWQDYLASIQTIKATSAEDLNLTQENYDALMAYVQDGSEEAAELAASIADAITSGNEEAVTDLANTLDEVTSAQEDVAAETAEWQTDFEDQMADYQAAMEAIVTDDLDLSDEAAESAKATIDSYVEQILAGKTAAVAAAQEVANAVAAALAGASSTADTSGSTSSASSSDTSSSSTVEEMSPDELLNIYTEYESGLKGIVNTYGKCATGTTNSPDTFIAGDAGHELVIPAHASGTTDGEELYMAGENGPELIVGEPGSEVFPTSETDRLIDALSGEAVATPYEENSDITYDYDIDNSKHYEDSANIYNNSDAVYEGDSYLNNYDQSVNSPVTDNSMEESYYQTVGDTTGYTYEDDQTQESYIDNDSSYSYDTYEGQETVNNYAGPEDASVYTEGDDYYTYSGDELSYAYDNSVGGYYYQYRGSDIANDYSREYGATTYNGDELSRLYDQEYNSNIYSGDQETNTQNLYGGDVYNTYTGDTSLVTQEGASTTENYGGDTASYLTDSYEGDRSYITYDGDNLYYAYDGDEYSYEYGGGTENVSYPAYEGDESYYTTYEGNETPLYIINNSNDDGQTVSGNSRNTSGEETKRIVLEISGSGSIEIDSSVDEDTVLELLQDNLKPVLLSILKQEVYEEGDLSYEY